jgi:preprotein translocase subunit SecE
VADGILGRGEIVAVDVKSMDSKKTQKKTSTVSSAQQSDVQNFFGDVKTEFKKITWTDKDELKAYTKIVVGATLICSFSVFFVDLAIRGGLTTFEAVVRFIFG